VSAPDLDSWMPRAAVCVSHRAWTPSAPGRVWSAARELRLSDTRLLGRLIRWRIPGVEADTSFEGLFTKPPFVVLEQGELELVSGIVGRIWTIRRDYPLLTDPEQFRSWQRPGTVRALFANWVQPARRGGALLCSETRIQPFGAQGRVGLTSVRPLIAGFHHLVKTDAMAAALSAAQRP
jgi:hypothetical protein